VAEGRFELGPPAILMKRCYHYTDQGHQFIMIRLEVFVAYVICFPLRREKGVHCTARKGGAGEETPSGEEDGTMWIGGELEGEDVASEW
jgi:hypothetical protein